MKIKNAEEMTGLPAKTIKYYEEEGFICPKRNEENNYRDYSEEDITALKKIKLLRKLNFSIETIKSILSSKNSTKEILENHIIEIDETIKTQMRIKDFVKEMLVDFNQTENLDLVSYLEKLSLLESEGHKFMNENVKETQFKKDSSFTFLMLLGYVFLVISTGVLLSKNIINIYIFLVVTLGSLLLLVARHSSTTGYVCNSCGGRFNINLITDLLSPHTTNAKLLKCPHCKHRGWAKESYRAD